jgi:hypothetical protein
MVRDDQIKVKFEKDLMKFLQDSKSFKFDINDNITKSVNNYFIIHTLTYLMSDLALLLGATEAIKIVKQKKKKN